ncbi:hypothetical protein ILUMI_26250 [Ignelater luminosus]|uniref:U2A'/phosphoprotein 32 family A C-terminal domain-containing protein n=1 Tax=Ignelater luminosus TaxID=2038154 RepID=A0A8K0C701_IGNLU|nr:hypothetical protein ILUMI_26250 [Ignelater luminosus]
MDVFIILFLLWLWTSTEYIDFMQILMFCQCCLNYNPSDLDTALSIIKLTDTNLFFQMVRITEELIRKKSEHNEGIIGTLEELSLHQEDVEKIEYVHNWCKDLQILLLQSNLISKIENLNKLKKLQYLNLAINNIEKVENLENCESLEKLDLTLNFIGNIESICSLKANIHLKYLYIVGNPCMDYEGYRDYVIAKLPQIEYLDTSEVTRSERLKALQTIDETEIKVKKAQKAYEEFRAKQRDRLAYPQEFQDDEEFWKASSEHAPETRVEISKRRSKNKVKEERTEKKPIKLYAQDGRPLNINQAKIDFKFEYDDPKEYVLDMAVYRYLDTNLINVDVQPNYVRVIIKGKVFQLGLTEEVYVDKSTAQRSQTTGHLVIKMPKVNYKAPLEIKPVEAEKLLQMKEKIVIKHAYLEVGEKDQSLDFSKIVENNRKNVTVVEDPDIPPLEYG